MTPGWYLAALAYVAVPATLFVVIYHSIARWWETPVGRNIMFLMGSIAATLDLGFLNLMLGRPEWMRWVLLACYLGIGTAIWVRLHILIKAQSATPLEVHRRDGLDAIESADTTDDGSDREGQTFEGTLGG